MKKLFAISCMAALLSLVLSGCVGSSGSPNGDTTLNINMTDYKFDPSAWTVPAGKTITVNLKNSGSAPHTWTIMTKPITGPYTSADKPDILFDSGTLESGSSKTFSFTAPSTPGNFQVICIVRGHLEFGMVGQLTVK